ncbi:MAG: F420-nonreducing hydrogenase [Candidatus Jordarchaeaceae archaeon]|nr:F420-nonreducing hydrogenase [Candidatus Jordarchaeia archaeon]MBS7280470.1 F420-nonreducing hydrogenase [Candidatus Jordarchaeia archaeon]
MSEIDPKILNLMEMVMRAYDCCLSCSAFLIVLDNENRELAKREIVIGSA